jgi:uncharacterized protein
LPRCAQLRQNFVRQKQNFCRYGAKSLLLALNLYQNFFKAAGATTVLFSCFNVFMKRFILIFCFSILTLSACAKKENLVLNKNTVRVNGHGFAVEIADTSEKQIQGLSGRVDLAENSGMLFVYNDYNIRLFWMKEMRFPLDIVWIKDNLVIGCSEKVPVLDKEGHISRVESPGEANYVLEINAGLCGKYDIKDETEVEIKR